MCVLSKQSSVTIYRRIIEPNLLLIEKFEITNFKTIQDYDERGGGRGSSTVARSITRRINLYNSHLY